jgi:hypothetical protein
MPCRNSGPGAQEVLEIEGPRCMRVTWTSANAIENWMSKRNPWIERSYSNGGFDLLLNRLHVVNQTLCLFGSYPFFAVSRHVGWLLRLLALHNDVD